MRGRLVTGDFALTELFHQLSMLNPFGGLKLKTVLFEEINGHIKCCTLVAIHKGMVAGDRLGIAGGKLECVRFAVGVLVLRSRQGGLHQSNVSQPLCTACHLDHGLMDELDLLACHPFGVRHLLASSMMVLR